MRAGGRDAEVPGAEVPHDGGGQQREHHHHALRRVDVQQQVGRNQVDDGVGHGQTAKEHAEEVEEAGQQHGGLRFHRLGVDDGCNGVGGVVKAVDEFKGEHEGDRQHQRDREQCVESRKKFQHD
ncbi:hypothetical protein D3C72_2135010 [compost metagenome]